jgi:4-hydroxybenzoate polyprenyltransferase
MIKFEHSVFALPFALAGALLAAGGRPPVSALLWIVVAMVGARSLAMTLNRIVDHSIDAANPRTAGRALPAGKLRTAEAWVFAACALAVLLVAVYRLHPVCRWLWPPVVLIFFLYPYTKRFTWASHFVLGLSLGLAPVGAWVAVTGEILSPIWLLGAAVTLWTAGFDIIYACQDHDFDVRHGLCSIPARFGPRASLLAARLLHVASFLLLVALGAALGLDGLYHAGLAAVAVLLLYEHRLVSPADLSNIDLAFFTMNGAIAAVFLIFTAADLALPILL